MKTFTKKFFELSIIDQCAIVNQRIADLEQAIRCSVDIVSERRLRRMHSRLTTQAQRFGLRHYAFGPIKFIGPIKVKENE